MVNGLEKIIRKWLDEQYITYLADGFPPEESVDSTAYDLECSIRDISLLGPTWADEQRAKFK